VVVDSDIDNASIDLETLPDEEKFANLAAANFCVPQKEMESFIARVSPLFSRTRVLAFAQKQGIHPGLVVGQIQRHLDRYDLFRQMLVPVRNIITPIAMTDGFGHVIPIDI
jgi:HTH-type transcriptional regulator/antitoxin HigA